jgi:hypothetical protein
MTGELIEILPIKDIVMQKMDSNKKSALKRFLQIAIGISVLIVFLKIDWKLRGSEAMRHQDKVVSELDQLRPFSNALLMSKTSSVKTDTGVLDAKYEVQGKSSTGIEQWYKEEFGRLNWRPLSVESHQSKRLLRFCRNGETAILILPEDSLAAKTEFQIEIGWGSSFGC